MTWLRAGLKLVAFQQDQHRLIRHVPHRRANENVQDSADVFEVLTASITATAALSNEGHPGSRSSCSQRAAIESEPFLGRAMIIAGDFHQRVIVYPSVGACSPTCCGRTGFARVAPYSCAGRLTNRFRHRLGSYPDHLLGCRMSASAGCRHVRETSCAILLCLRVCPYRQPHREAEPLPGSLVTVTSPPIMRASLRVMCPKGEVRRLLDHLVGEREQIVRYFEAERLRGLEVDDELDLGRLHDRQVGRPLAL